MIDEEVLKCPICFDLTPVLVAGAELLVAIGDRWVDRLERDLPDWRRSQGLCGSCVESATLGVLRVRL
jgi:hypothetical protein